MWLTLKISNLTELISKAKHCEVWLIFGWETTRKCENRELKGEKKIQEKAIGDHIKRCMYS